MLVILRSAWICFFTGTRPVFFKGVVSRSCYFAGLFTFSRLVDFWCGKAIHTYKVMELVGKERCGTIYFPHTKYFLLLVKSSSFWSPEQVQFCPRGWQPMDGTHGSGQSTDELISFCSRLYVFSYPSDHCKKIFDDLTETSHSICYHPSIYFNNVSL